MCRFRMTSRGSGTDYLRLTRAAAEHCENHDLTDSMVIGTSAIVDTEIDGAAGMNSGILNIPVRRRRLSGNPGSKSPAEWEA